jgi:nucleoside-triphosphatase THEP1
MTQALPIAAIVYDTRGAADGPMADFARSLRERGRTVRGLIQEQTRDGPGGARRMMLTDLESGERFDISQKLGAGPGCVDPGVLAAASTVLRRALAQGTDLVMVSRFGELEAAGGGFAAEMLELMGEGVPLLTAVGEKYLESWRRFTDGAGAELSANPESLDAWFESLGK